MLGPLIGGLLTDHVSWKWCFLVPLPTGSFVSHKFTYRCFFINLPTGGFALAVLVFTLHLNPHKAVSLGELKRTFDFFGLFLIIAGVVLVLVGFSAGDTAWKTAETITLLTVGGIVLIAAAVWETRTTRSQIIPPRLFKVSFSSSFRWIWISIADISRLEDQNDGIPPHWRVLPFVCVHHRLLYVQCPPLREKIY